MSRLADMYQYNGRDEDSDEGFDLHQEHRLRQSLAAELGLVSPAETGLQGSYMDDPGTKLISITCIRCGKPLRNLHSVEQGCGSVCADKMMFVEGARGSTDTAALMQALNAAPKGMKLAFQRGTKRGGEFYGVSACLSLVGWVWEFHDALTTRPYLESLLQIADAAGFHAMASALTKRVLQVERDAQVAELALGEGYVPRRGDRVRMSGKARNSAAGKAGTVRAEKRDGTKVLIEFDDGTEGWFGFDNLQKESREQVVPARKRYTVADFEAATYPLEVMSRGQKYLVRALKQGNFGPYLLTKETPPGKRGPFLDIKDVDEVLGSVEAPPPPPPPKYTWADFPKGSVVRLQDGSEWTIVLAGLSKSSGKPYAKAKGRQGQEEFIYPEQVAEVLVKAKPAEDLNQRFAKRELKRAGIKADPRLFAHQVEGASWLAMRTGAILADDMGLGKTATSITAMTFPAVVLCPASLRSNWAREVRTWSTQKPSVSVIGEKGQEDYGADVVIVNYERLKDDVLEKLKKRQNTCLIVDEAHALKNLRVSMKGDKLSVEGSSRAENTWDLAYLGGPKGERISQVFLLTGTPMPNGRHEELFSLVNIAAGSENPLFQNFYNFCSRFCPPQTISIGGGRTAKTFTTNAGAEELRSLIAPFYLRRDKDLLNLPPKSIMDKVIDMSDSARKEYQKALLEFRRWLGEKKKGDKAAYERALRAEAIVRLTELRKICAVGKVPGIIEEVLAHMTNFHEPLVIMAHHKEVISSLEKALQDEGYTTSRIDGSVATSKRQSIVDAFQAGKTNVILCSVSAAGVGITLTAARTMFFVERVWRPFDMKQAEDRIHRIGQDKPTTICYLDAPSSIDTILSDVMQSKMAAADKVLKGAAIDERSAAQAEDLVDSVASEESVLSAVLDRLNDL